MCNINRFTSKFDTVSVLRIKLIVDFQDLVPNSVDIDVGYCEGSQQSKTWLVTSIDLKTMYQRYTKVGQATL